MKQYYVVYESKDTGYYETTYWVVCVTEDLDVAKDLCEKFGYDYDVETVGEKRNTPDYVKSREPHAETKMIETKVSPRGFMLQYI